MKLVIIGQGYVGLPLADAAVRAGLNVTGLEINQDTVTRLNAGVSHVDDISQAELEAMVAAGYSATTDTSVIATADVVVICVPTPLTDAGKPDLSAISSAVTSVAENLSPSTLVVLESTTYPGTTNDIVLPILLKSGLQLDEHFHLAFSPERIDPGNAVFGLRNTPKVVGGVSAASTEAAAMFYAKILETVVTTKGSREAETAKLLENTYRHVNIALLNEMAKFCHELGIDLWDVIRAASTKPFGFEAFYPGPGVGGHCIPIDPNYLSYEVERTLGYPFRFVELAGEINNGMPRYVVDRIQDLLNAEGRALKGARILLLGISYKANVSDQRESPAAPIAKILEARGAIVSYHDPRVSEWSIGERALSSVRDLEESLRDCDVAVLLQTHREYAAADDLARLAPLFFDTRGITQSDFAHRL